MCIDYSKLLFLPLDIPNPPNVSKILDSFEYDEMLKDNYRKCYHIPLMDGDGKWLNNSSKLYELVNWCEEHLFSWAQKSRIMIITTPSGGFNPYHIDCSPKKFNTWQHKFRYVLRGNVDSLHFLCSKNKHNAPQIDKPFIMNGKWPHAMSQNYHKTKYTLALGSPWEPNQSDEKYINMLDKSFKKYHEYYLSHDELSLPKNYSEMFEKHYTN